MGRTLIKCLDWRISFDNARKRVTVEYEIQGDERSYVVRRLCDGLVGANGSSYTHDQVKKGDVLRRPGFHHVEDARQRVDALNAMDRCNFREAFARQRGIEEESEGSAELKEDESE